MGAFQFDRGAFLIVAKTVPFARFHGVLAGPRAAAIVPLCEKNRSTFVLAHTMPRDP